MFLAGSD